MHSCNIQGGVCVAHTAFPGLFPVRTHVLLLLTTLINVDHNMNVPVSALVLVQHLGIDFCFCYSGQKTFASVVEPSR